MLLRRPKLRGAGGDGETKKENVVEVMTTVVFKNQRSLNGLVKKKIATSDESDTNNRAISDVAVLVILLGSIKT